ncbi:MAG: 16S rRNA (adenine(1518)-N(6)/adenine(1519)-N(6))-dimethyltransferase RsmA [Blastocatellia bacterium]
MFQQAMAAGEAVRSHKPQPMSVYQKAKRRFGQNFLVRSEYCDRIVASVRPRTDETILEIGPGQGALTELLIETGARIVAIEVDRDLILPLTRSFASRENFTLIEADALTFDFSQAIAPAATARVVANLPYNISTPILQRLIEHRHCISEMTLMLQREVVERITATPGGKEYGYLSVLVQLYCEPESLFDVPPSAFRPVPKVVSSIVKLKVRPEPAAVVSDEALFVELTKTLFAQRRKTILNNLRSGWTRLGLASAEQIKLVLAASELDPQRRAETLTITEMARLANNVKTV